MGMEFKVQDVSFAYNGQGRLLEALSFTLDSGTCLGIAGPNGAGKTTLIQLLCGLLKPSSGKIYLGKQAVQRLSPSALAKRVALVRQHSQVPFGFTVQETVLMARTAYLDWTGFETQEDRDKVEQAMSLTGVTHLANRSIHSLSGGECQRVFIARALAQDTDVLILDEPTNYLDLKHQVAVYDLLKSIQLDHGKTIITITHDLNMAMQYCDQILLLGQEKGQVHMGTPADVLTCEHIETVFGVSVVRLVQEEHTFFIPARISSK